MTIQIVDVNGLPLKVDGSKFNALRVNARPLDYGVNGAYTMSVRSGVLAAGLVANSEIFQFRWGEAVKKCVIQEILLEGAYSVAAFTAGAGDISAFVARAWTASGTGGTASVMTGNNGKLRTDMATSLLTVSGDARISSTAALGAGTKVVDTVGIGAIFQGIPAAAFATIFNNNALFQPDDLHPVILEQNEGLILRANVPATGTWQFGVTIRWTEVDTFL